MVKICINKSWQFYSIKLDNIDNLHSLLKFMYVRIHNNTSLYKNLSYFVILETYRTNERRTILDSDIFYIKYRYTTKMEASISTFYFW